MKIFCVLIAALLLCTRSYGQERLWTVKSGENIKGVLSDSVIYRYPEFQQGLVYFKNATVSGARLNLNQVNGEMQFINASNDTMTVDYEKAIRFITINTDTFYFSNVFIESVQGNTIARLAKMVTFEPVDMQKVGGYDQATATSSINSASYFFNGNQSSSLTPNKLVILRKKDNYFIGDKFNHFLPASKKNILKLFNKQQQFIERYLKENKVVFVNKDDLLKLIEALEINNNN